MISEMRWRWRIQEEYIGILAGLEAACVRRKVKGSRAVQGEGGERFFYGHAHIEHGKRKDKGDGLAIAGARI